MIDCLSCLTCIHCTVMPRHVEPPSLWLYVVWDIVLNWCETKNLFSCSVMSYRHTLHGGAKTCNQPTWSLACGKKLLPPPSKNQNCIFSFFLLRSDLHTYTCKTWAPSPNCPPNVAFGYIFSCPEQLNRWPCPLVCWSVRPAPLTIRVFTTVQSDPGDWPWPDKRQS